MEQAMLEWHHDSSCMRLIILLILLILLGVPLEYDDSQQFLST